MKKPKRQAKAVSKGKPSPPKKPAAKQTKVTKIPRLDGKRGKDNDVSWHERFLLSLRQDFNVSTACRVAGVTRNSAYEHREKFPMFAQEWDIARASARKMRADAIEESFLDRVEHGVPAFTGTGEPIRDPKSKKQMREFNETAVLRSLSALRPEVWSEKHKVEFSGKLTMTAQEELEASRETKKSLLLTLAGGLNGSRAT